MKPEMNVCESAGTLCKLKTQSVVECRLGGEIDTVLAVHATATLTGADALDGEVRYAGKVFLEVIYEDADKKICRCERGAEFTHHADSELVTPTCKTKVTLSTQRTSVRREGASVYVSVIVGAEIDVITTTSFEYLAGGEGLITRKEENTLLRVAYCGGDTELEDEFDTDTLGDILLHAENVYISYIGCEVGTVTISGEVALSLCAMKEEGLYSYERLIPFKMEIPCDEAASHMEADGNVTVSSVNISAAVDEDKGKSHIVVTMTLHAESKVYIKETLSVCADAFSVTNEVKLVKDTHKVMYCADTIRMTERISGVTSLSGKVDFTDRLQAVALPVAEGECQKTEKGYEIQGVFTALLLVEGADGSHRVLTAELPFAFPFQGGEGEQKVQILPCGVSLRQKREGEVEAEATLKVSVGIYRESDFVYIQGVEEGAVIEQSQSAFSVFLPQKGDSIWDIAKRLKKTPEEVQSSNPSLTFPVKEGERIVVYRQKELS